MRLRKLRRKIVNRLEVILSAALICVFAVIGGMLDYPDQVADEEGYCAMVRLHQNSGGNAGWPAYRGECKSEKWVSND